MEDCPGYDIQIKVGLRLWFESEGLAVFGQGLTRLLSRIEELGTLQQAVQAEGISYRHAWEKIRKAEKRLGAPLLFRRTGGRGGGDSRLSPEGQQLLKVYRQLQRETLNFAQRRYAELCRTTQDH